MGVQAENWLSKHNPTTDHCECHPRSPLCPPIRGQDLLCPRGCLAYIPYVTSRAARQSQSGSITITQQLCVFVEDYIFKRTLGGGRGWGKWCDKLWRCSLKGAESRGPHPRWPCCVGKSTHTIRSNMADCVVVISSVFTVFLSLLLSLPNHFHSLHAKALGEKYDAKLKLYTRRLNSDTEWYVWWLQLDSNALQ